MSASDLLRTGVRRWALQQKSASCALRSHIVVQTALRVSAASSSTALRPARLQYFSKRTCRFPLPLVLAPCPAPRNAPSGASCETVTLPKLRRARPSSGGASSKHKDWWASPTRCSGVTGKKVKRMMPSVQRRSSRGKRIADVGGAGTANGIDNLPWNCPLPAPLATTGNVRHEP